jgi:RHS repeat-associated protein
MEKDDELSGEGNSYDFGERMYNPRIGRWSSTDPFEDRMPQVSPYSYALNNPIYLVDEDGELPIIPFLIKAGAAAAADALLQASLIYLTDESVDDFGSAFKKIDKSDVAWSFVEGLNPFKIPGGKFGEAAAAASADVLIYIGEQTIDGNDITTEGIGQEFIIGFMSQLAGDQASKLLSNKTVRKKLGGLLGADKLDEILHRFDTRAPDEIKAAGGFDSWGDQKDLMDHATGKNIKNKTSNYVGTSKTEEGALNLAGGRKGYIYQIENPGTGVDVNKKLGDKSPFKNEQEIAVPDKIPNKKIKSSKPVNQ